MEEPSSEPKETRPASLVSLKTAAASLRDSILQAEKEEEWRGRASSRGQAKNIEKLRRQLAELEAQLVLASPHLLFQVTAQQQQQLTTKFKESLRAKKINEILQM